MNEVMAVNSEPNHEINLAERLAKCEEENKQLTREKNEIMREFNARMKVHLEEVRLLKEVNEGLQNDLEELRDLCCYLDDDRHNCRKLAREWQNFGRYVSSTLQSKETSYQEEVNSFSSQHQTILAENYKLRKLCEDLERRTRNNQPKEYICSRCSQQISLDSNQNIVSKRQPPSYAEVINQANAERRSVNSEESYTDEDSPVFLSNGNTHSKTPSVTKRKKRVSFAESDETFNEDGKPKHVPFKTESNGLLKDQYIFHGILRNGVKKNQINDQSSTSSADSDLSVNNMSRAMQVLEIHSELENERNKDPLKDKEVAVLQEMCNVVWRKLSNDGPFNGDTGANSYQEDIIYEDLL